MSEKIYAEEIASALRQLAKIGAYNIITNPSNRDKSNKEKIIMLYQFGFDQSDIAILIDTTPGTVRKELSYYKNN